MSSVAEDRSRRRADKQAVASLPSFSELVSQIRSLLTRDNLTTGMEKLVNLYLPIVYTYVTYRVPALAKLGAYIQQSSIYLTVRQRLLEYIAPSAGSTNAGPKPVEGSPENGGTRGIVAAAQDKITDKLVEIGDKGQTVIGHLLENTTTGKVIGKIAEKTVTGKVIKRLVTKNRARISEDEEEEEEEKETRAGPQTEAPENRIAEPQPESQPPAESVATNGETTAAAEDKPSGAEEFSPSTGRKIIFPTGDELQAALPLPSPSVTTRLEDRGPEGWREAQRLNSLTVESHL